jgi:hypothetical protein
MPIYDADTANETPRERVLKTFLMQIARDYPELILRALLGARGLKGSSEDIIDLLEMDAPQDPEEIRGAIYQRLSEAYVLTYGDEEDDAVLLDDDEGNDEPTSESTD